MMASFSAHEAFTLHAAALALAAVTAALAEDLVDRCDLPNHDSMSSAWLASSTFLQG